MAKSFFLNLNNSLEKAGSGLWSRRKLLLSYDRLYWDFIATKSGLKLLVLLVMFFFLRRRSEMKWKATETLVCAKLIIIK